MKNLVDLHIHSTASDGSFSPEEIVEMAHKKGLSAIALTDHDTISGLDIAQKKAEELGIEFIRGCEISTQYEDFEVHIVGLFVPNDLKNYPHFTRMLDHFQHHRSLRNEKICEKLTQLGIPTRIEDIYEIALQQKKQACLETSQSTHTIIQTKPICMTQSSHIEGNIHVNSCSTNTNSPSTIVVGRPHFAKYLMNKNICKTPLEAFENYLAKGAKAYVPRLTLKAHEAIEILVQSNILAIFAHPMLLRCSHEKREYIIQDLVKYGLQGIEAYHSAHSQKDENIVVKLAHKYKLCLSGGSDFHGESRKQIQLGTGRGSLRVPRFILDKLKTFNI